jgi:hypothetical protein
LRIANRHWCWIRILYRVTCIRLVCKTYPWSVASTIRQKLWLFYGQIGHSYETNFDKLSLVSSKPLKCIKVFRAMRCGVRALWLWWLWHAFWLWSYKLIATLYRMDSPGIESRWRRDFAHLSRPALGPTQPPIQWVPGLSPGGKTAGTWGWPPPSSKAEVKERVELCFLVFVACYRVNFTLSFTTLEVRTGS